MKVCGNYLGDNDGTCPQLTCIRQAGHTGRCDNVDEGDPLREAAIELADWAESVGRSLASHVPGAEQGLLLQILATRIARVRDAAGRG